MGNKVEKYTMEKEGKEGYSFWCPGCKGYHGMIVKGDSKKGPVWGWNGSLDKPTFKPSLLVRSVSCPDNPEKNKDGSYVLESDGRIKVAKDIRCHSYINDGKIQFLGDCSHDIKGHSL